MKSRTLKRGHTHTMNPELRMLYVTTVKARWGSARGASDTVTHLRGYIVHLFNMLLKWKTVRVIHIGRKRKTKPAPVYTKMVLVDDEQETEPELN